jgi:pimeloyl-ACP methyl ester carboxylesterase
MELFVDISGSGPDLILLHGWQNDTTIWSGVIAELTPVARCIAVDLPGHGQTGAAPLAEYERDAVLTSLDAIVQECTQPPVFVGHSLGGFLSLSYAVTRPDAVAGLVLVAAGPGYRSDGPRNDWNQWVLDNANPDAPDGQERICLQHDSLVVDNLQNIVAPTGVVVGDRDKGFHAARDVFESKMPNAWSVEIADAGHMVHVKKPVETAAAVRRVAGI